MTINTRPVGALHDSAAFQGWIDQLERTVNDKYVLLASGSFPAATTLSITDIPEIYSYLHIYWNGASSNTNTRQMLIRVSTNNGSSYDSTASNYVGYQYTGSAVLDSTLAALNETGNVASGATNTGVCVIEGYQEGVYAKYSSMMFANTVRYAVNGYYASTSNIDAIQFLWNGTGNFDAGTYALYGVR